MRLNMIEFALAFFWPLDRFVFRLDKHGSIWKEVAPFWKDISALVSVAPRKPLSSDPQRSHYPRGRQNKQLALDRQSCLIQFFGMARDLDGKVALVTGASSGIGRAIARRLNQCGCRLVISGRSEARLDALAAELGPATVTAPHDLVIEDEIVRPLSTAEEVFGQLDILILNAGLFSSEPFSDEEIGVSQKMIDVNFSSVVHLVHAALPLLKKRDRAEILAVGSIAGVSDMRNEAVYSATKHALNAFLRSLRRQVANEGIRVSSILPGTVATELWGLTDATEIDSKIARKEVLRAEDIAGIAEFVLKQPPHVAIRELVVLPQAQDI